MSWFKKDKEKKTHYLKRYLNRYQIQVYSVDGNMIHCDVHEGFTFEDACDEALVEIKKKIDIKTIETPLEFHYSGFKDK